MCQTPGRGKGARWWQWLYSHGGGHCDWDPAQDQEWRGWRDLAQTGPFGGCQDGEDPCWEPGSQTGKQRHTPADQAQGKQEIPRWQELAKPKPRHTQAKQELTQDQSAQERQDPAQGC